jgi:hypothetical protein
MDWVTAPLDHVFPVEALEVSTTLPPWQKASGPPADTVGAGTLGYTVTEMADETAVQPADVVAETE